ncbi:flagellar basal body rod protein FlgC [Silvanigrella paludirubra]|jgi:flagellar basal-body rod protein FlgC|uniref:Flagellar basal-body rod protein FlgC n=1 Tax=Silvanigrella paludirubra TaxID=2499159 RepID=A0A6N6VTT1_9BACT|nr:flagellar basal body rod protein FlgC [Silvanigrella paludirubra]KAB8039593.1 flagellar basal body rod protein FlgC [Silvanigrella paludirubra]
MSFLEGLKISASGLSAERIRMNVISSNLANANTSRTEEGGPYKRKDVLFTARNSGLSFDNLMRLAFDPNLKEVKVDGITEDRRAPRLVYNPNHPDANENGYVAMPNISVMEEMVNMITSNRSFESDTQAINATKSMAMTAIGIGR